MGILVGAIALAVVVVATVLLVTLGGGGGEQIAQTPPASSPSPSPAALLAPTGLRATLDGVTVLLAWSEPTGGATPEGYQIHRGDTLLASVPITIDAYTDKSVVPGKSYTYSVQSALVDALSPPATVQLVVTKPPLTAARLAGSFDIKAKVSSSSGFQNIKNSSNYGFSFKPKCSSGPCDVGWSIIGLKGISARLTRAGAVYMGQDTGNFHVTCSSANVSTTWALTFHVAQAKGVNGVWRASKIVGTIDESSPAQLGCVSSHATETFSGTLVGT
jgi:hypothetical protein